MTLRRTLEDTKSQGRAALVAYITAGDPDLGATKLFVRALAQAGVDLIELGVPFSDPVADGPTIQAASARALQSGTTLEKVLGLARELHEEGVTPPLILFTYLNPVYRLGFADFAARARGSGISGTLIVDLPPEEADEYLEVVKRHGLETVFLASPTTRAERLGAVEGASTGFVYYASRTGVTGVQDALSSTVLEELERTRSRIKAPLAVGFGISKESHVRALAPVADAIVVGSAFVKIIEQSSSTQIKAQELRRLAESFVKELQRC